jgi:glycosyltransferase involved in cell wall biosynthesis
MQQLPSDTHLTIFGAGEDRAALDRQARSSGISGRVHLAGFSNDVACWIAGADAFVLPSRWEGLPNVVLESLALGTPVIASTQAAVGELALQCPAGAVTVCQVETEFPAAICAIEASATACELRPSLLPYTYSSASAIASWEGLIQDVLGREELQ